LISEVPLELLGSSLKLSMTLEAVQAEHGAVSKVFGKAGDTRGYYSSWS